MKKPIGYYNYSVIATYISFLSAVAGIMLAAGGNTDFACYCLLLSGLLDMFDGKIARRCKRTEDEKSFGIQIDSLCDLVAFGVLPGAILASQPGIYNKVVAGLFALCALIRLAYFNVDEIKRSSATTENRKAYTGMPVTMASLFLPAFFAADRLLQAFYTPVCTVVMVIVGALFIMPVKVKKPQGKGGIALIALGIAEVAILILG